MKTIMLRMVFFAVALLSATHMSAQFSLNKVWETDAVLNTPESVLYDAKSKVLYVSNIGDFQKASRFIYWHSQGNLFSRKKSLFDS